MRENFRFCVSDEFKHFLFQKAIRKMGSERELAKTLRCTQASINGMKNGKTRFIKWQVLKQLINITKTSIEKLEAHVISIKKGDGGKPTFLSLPIKESPELALLVAKSMGDGTLERNNRRFSFRNNEKILIEEVCKNVNKGIGLTEPSIIERKDGSFEVKFNSVVGLVIHLFGGPIGSKTIQSFDVPDWIKNGSKEIKASFIRGLFDDEATIRNDKHKNGRISRGIIIAQAKSIEKLNSLKVFFRTIKDILFEFDISSSRITEQKRFEDKNGIGKVILRFSINKKVNLENFFTKIGFSHPNKQQELKESIESFKDIHKTRDAILDLVINSALPLSTSDIASKLNMKRESVLPHLLELSKQKKIEKCKSTPNLWFKEKTSLMMSKEEKVISILKKFKSLTIKNISLKTGVKEKSVFFILDKLRRSNQAEVVGKVKEGNTRLSLLWSINGNIS